VIEHELVRPLERLPEVSRVDTMGLNPMEIRVEVDDKRANAAGVSVAQIIERLQNDNFTMSAGIVEAGDARYPLRVLGRLDDLESLRSLPIGGGMRLSDIARVEAVRPEQEEIYRVNGEPGYILAIYKESSQNTVATAEAIRVALDRIAPQPNSDIELNVFFDQGDVIEGSLANLTETALWGGLFAIIILFLFLRRARMTFVTATAIPLSLLITVTVMYFTDSSLNALSLMGLMLSVGMVVDNSIVVTEAIQRRRAEGQSIVAAAAGGASEVGLAIVVATSTTIVVFLPMVLMSGSETISFYLGKIGYPVCIALVASLVVSLIFIPLAITWLDTEEPPPSVAIIEWVQDSYATSLRWCLNHRSTAVIVAVGLMASIAIPNKEMTRTDKLEANINDIRIFFDFEPAVTFDERYARLKDYEAWIVEHREELEVRTWMTRMGGMWGRPQMRLFLEGVDDRELSRDEVIEKIRAGFPHYSGSDWRIGWSAPGTDQKVTVDVEGPDPERLGEFAQLIALRLRTLDDINDVIVGEDDARALELRYYVNEEAAQRTGVNPLMIGGAIDYALRGRRIGDVRYQERDIPLWVRTDPTSTASKAALDNLALPSPIGGPGIPIGDVTSTEIAPGYNEIEKVNGQTRVEIQVLTTREDLDRLGEEIDAILSQVELPRGYGVAKGQRFANLQSDAEDRNFALFMAIVFVFLLMGVLFESFVLPFVIILSIPFAFLGVYWTLYVTGTPFDVMAGVGLIILVGIVVNNAIVLVDRVNVLIAERDDREEALIEAGRVRLRPIVMTALTTICGLIPMAIGSSAIVGVPYAPLGRTVIGGLLASTVLTLFVVPIFYTLIDDLRRSVVGVVSGD
jgi:HAE1 family hydrophobic/amphiphilic exporter-1